MRIQHNIMAMNAYRNYNTNNSALSKNLEKLSSGYAINRAGDDAAGLAISEKMRAQITGLDTAQKNAKDGVSLVQTAEGALTEVHDMLNRMVELATQSANGTYENETDRAQLQKEIEQLTDEIDRIADSANFNGINLLDGTLAGKTTTTGATVGTMTSTDGQTPTAATKAEITITLDGTNATTGVAITGGTTTVSAAGNLTVNGHKLSDLFDIEVTTTNGTVSNWSSTNKIASSATIKLTAKTAGNLETATISALEGITGAKDVVVEDGTPEGVGANATSTKYSLEFNFDNIADGQTFSIGGNLFEISTDGVLNNSAATIIDIKGLANDTSTGKHSIATKIQAALATKFTTGTWKMDTVGAAGTFTTGVTSFKINFSSIKKGADTGLGAVRVSQNAAGAITGIYEAGKDQAKGDVGKFATVTYDGFDLSALSVGNTITIGGKTVTVVNDDEADATQGKLTLSQAKNSTKLVEAFEQLGFEAGKISISGTKLTITDSVVGNTGAAFAAGDGKVTISASSTSSTSGGLVLQIGDTADSFNQLRVSVQDMHSDELGLDAIDIGTQEGAQSAIKVIKDAINTVSDVRGTLGATQNRLDHTMNNLSVMEENIQDAESTIRDTDVAEEMMAYTKNNILIQSAQAMLAQANQVPQGVLQLLG